MIQISKCRFLISVLYKVNCSIFCTIYILHFYVNTYYVRPLRNIEVEWMMTSFMLTLTTDVDMENLLQKKKKIKVTNVKKMCQFVDKTSALEFNGSLKVSQADVNRLNAIWNAILIDWVDLSMYLCIRGGSIFVLIWLSRRYDSTTAKLGLKRIRPVL